MDRLVHVVQIVICRQSLMRRRRRTMPISAITQTIAVTARRAIRMNANFEAHRRLLVALNSRTGAGSCDYRKSLVSDNRRHRW